ncbi:MAG: pseudaminic acid cytidylyltransferase [Bacteriovoracia bacterium]
MNKNRIAIITARGGSKRIPRKNIRVFHGRPILAYPIEAALTSKLFAEVMVSTDDPEIAEIAKSAGATVPFFRSAKNSDDHAGTAEVILEVLEAFARQGRSFETFCCLYPTSPFVNAARLQSAMKLLEEGNTKTVIPVVAFSPPIQRALKIESGKLRWLDAAYAKARSQDLAVSYHDAGQFYCGKVAEFLQKPLLFSDDTAPLVLPETEVQDIDTEDDWKIAELKYQLLRGTKG